MLWFSQQNKHSSHWQKERKKARKKYPVDFPLTCARAAASNRARPDVDHVCIRVDIDLVVDPMHTCMFRWRSGSGLEASVDDWELLGSSARNFYRSAARPGPATTAHELSAAATEPPSHRARVFLILLLSQF